MSELKTVRLTKSGKPDKRSETSKKNLAKGKQKVQEILEKAKGKGEVSHPLATNSNEEYETDEDEEFELTIRGKSEKPRPLTTNNDPAPIKESNEQSTSSTTVSQEQNNAISTKEIIQNSGVVSGLPLTELKRILDEAELTKKEISDLKKIIKEQQLREQQRLDSQVQKDLDKVRQQAYGRLNSLSQQMSMKF